MEVNTLFCSQGVDVALATVWPRTPAGRATFPKKASELRSAELRARAPGDDVAIASYVQDWFPKVAGRIGGINECSITDKIAVIIDVSWEGMLFSRVHVQAVVTPHHKLTELEGRSPVPVHYFRMDQEPNNIGSVFKNSFPHLHVYTKGEPYLRPPDLGSGNVLVDLLEYLHKMYEYASWLRWVKSAYHGIVDELSADDRWDTFNGAFETDNLQALLSEPMKLQIVKLKSRLSALKHDAYPLRIDTSSAELLSYGW